MSLLELNVHTNTIRRNWTVRFQRSNIGVKLILCFLSYVDVMSHVTSLACVIEDWPNNQSNSKLLYHCLYQVLHWQWNYPQKEFKIERLGFSLQFIRVLQSLYADTVAVISWNEVSTALLKTKMGLKQGCILSLLIFSYIFPYIFLL